jgi:hypothetical protein
LQVSAGLLLPPEVNVRHFVVVFQPIKHLQNDRLVGLGVLVCRGTVPKTGNFNVSLLPWDDILALYAKMFPEAADFAAAFVAANRGQGVSCVVWDGNDNALLRSSPNLEARKHMKKLLKQAVRLRVH